MRLRLWQPQRARPESSEVEVNEVPTDALINTGSPATIVSLDFAMDVMAKERPDYITLDHWISAILYQEEV